MPRPKYAERYPLEIHQFVADLGTPPLERHPLTLPSNREAQTLRFYFYDFKRALERSIRTHRSDTTQLSRLMSIMNQFSMLVRDNQLIFVPVDQTPIAATLADVHDQLLKQKSRAPTPTAEAAADAQADAQAPDPDEAPDEDPDSNWISSLLNKE